MIEEENAKHRSKTYFFLKQYQDFYSAPEKTILLSGSTREEITRGQLMIYLYERMLNLSIKTEGFLRFSTRIPYTPKLLAQLFNLDVDLVDEAIQNFEAYGLVKIISDKKNTLNDGTIFMCELPMLIASITAETKVKSEQKAEAKVKKLFAEDDDVKYDPTLDND